MKKCVRCKRDLPDSAFRNSERKQCKLCNAARSKRQREHPAAASGWKHMLKKKGLTVEDYDRMFVEQHGVCAICQKPELTRRLSVDHDHVTLRVRGLLCHRCNVAIGLMLDDPIIITNALGYLAAQIS